ncbi:MAG: PAS domain S-box protein [Pseudomonadota bacterium]
MIHNQTIYTDTSHWRGSILAKLTGLVMFVIIVSGLIISVFSFQLAYRSLTHQIHAQLDTVAHDRAARLNAYAREKRKEVRLIASRTRLRQYLQDRLNASVEESDFYGGTRQILKDTLASSQEFIAIWITDPSGRVITATNQDYIGRDFSSHPDFQQGRQVAHLGIPRLVGEKFQVHLTAPANSNDNQFLGVVMVLVDASGLYELLSDTEGLGETGEVLVASPEREHLLYLMPPLRKPEQRSILATQAPAMLKAINKKDSGRGMGLYDGVEVLATWRPLQYQAPEFRLWGLVVKIDESEAYAPINELGWFQVILGIALVSIGGFLAFLFARRFTRPILQMAESTAKIADGDFNVRVAITSTDELGRLTNAFNQMASELAASYQILIEKEATAHQLAAIVESSDDAIIGFQPNGVITSWNKGAEILYGYTADEVLGQHILTAPFVPDHQQADNASTDFIKSLGEGNWITHYETERLHKNGSTLDVSLTLSPINNEQGQLIGISSIARDITERKRLEAAQEKLNQELAASNEALIQSNLELQQFAYVASHDLQAPLITVHSFAQILQQNYLGKMDPEADKWIDFIVSGAEQMRTLIDDLLEFSRVESQAKPFQRIDLCHVFDDSVKLMSTLIVEQQAEVTRDTLPVVSGDTSQLSQLFSNLLGNGIPSHFRLLLYYQCRH